MRQPLVSIIIPTFNRVDLIGETLDSVINQKYDYWECIIIDDRSTDATKELLEFYVEKDTRIKFQIRLENFSKGANTCRNIGLELSKGKYIQWLDSDDLLSCNKLEKQVKFLEENHGELATCKWGKILEEGSYLTFDEMESYKSFNSPLNFLNTLNTSQGYFPIHAYLMNRSIVKRAGVWNEDLQINQDGEFMIRIISEAEKIYFVDESYAFYRRMDSASTSKIQPYNFQELIYSWRLIEEYLNERFPGNNSVFVKEAKRTIYRKYREQPRLIHEHKSFFKEIIKEEPSDFKLNAIKLIFKFSLSRNIWKFLKKTKRKYE